MAKTALRRGSQKINIYLICKCIDIIKERVIWQI